MVGSSCLTCGISCRHVQPEFCTDQELTLHMFRAHFSDPGFFCVTACCLDQKLKCNGSPSVPFLAYNHPFCYDCWQRHYFPESATCLQGVLSRSVGSHFNMCQALLPVRACAHNRQPAPARGSWPPQDAAAPMLRQQLAPSSGPSRCALRSGYG